MIYTSITFYLIDRSATIAEDKATYWVEVKSDVFFIAGDANEHEGTNNGATVAGKADTTFYKYHAFLFYVITHFVP